MFYILFYLVYILIKCYEKSKFIKDARILEEINLSNNQSYFLILIICIKCKAELMYP